MIGPRHIRYGANSIVNLDMPLPRCYSMPMPMTKLTPIESEFATTEEAEAHDAWFRAQVETSLTDLRPSIPHEQVMTELRAIIEAKKNKQA
ncbi:hypothetical protein BH10PSE12_BH10PSE12_10400 [soil metagenome]